jgi:hypothetical protein
MLILSVVLSVGLMGLVHGAYRRKGLRPLGAYTFAVLGLVAGFCMEFPSLFLHAFFIFSGLLLCTRRQWSASTLLRIMTLGGLAAYGLFIYLAAAEMAEHQTLRQRYAFESMEARVPAPKGPSAANPLGKFEARWENLEKDVGSESNGFRTLMLERLHQESVRDFINSPGFGVGRRIRPTERTLKGNLDRDGTPIPQPGPRSSSTLGDGDLREPKNVGLDPLLEMHFKGILNFVNPSGFGLVVSRNKVAGFQSHQFNAVPEAREWKVRTLELVGLLLHDDPVVYVSDELPRMEQLRKAPARHLNPFEAAGLKRLEEGEDLFVRETPEGIRMLGAVRSIEQCLPCHGGKRGDLLGAFSYTLQRVP